MLCHLKFSPCIKNHLWTHVFIHLHKIIIHVKQVLIRKPNIISLKLKKKTNGLRN